MIKLSVSQAARRLGVSRSSIQDQINSGKLQTHEGYVTADSIRLAYPAYCVNSEQEVHLRKMQKIKADAMYKAGAADIIKQKNEQALMTIIASLKSKLYQEQMGKQHFQLVFLELSERLEVLEKCCHEQDKQPLNDLQSWVERHIH
ncbi:hypothetical protein [Candidatus Thioglobus sp.]|jgi:hypothetical protein|uniref:helix-turn-helix domain-containing protein n=1 Tax=Candidatus Thioglobus sp. TaxID=2026721 RepID=UPI001DDE2A61|nr:hypothetical protein [Candidatus Thioglobus sp.]MBT3277012.1 hypothetical protein [Candidatus Thioglobus sp.]MBT3446627.1 hypothetical protein [Candidatus Thioglobus sp.]MBT3745170.1 hypothetical protein [Candidatus Thioglobus sp.]MBT4000979.1 hypothetical protein [Candidatus Thioglobus sp.]MBT4181811.1 hypothetical protein [Candidatus Thioglobus sp.]